MICGFMAVLYAGLAWIYAIIMRDFSEIIACMSRLVTGRVVAIGEREFRGLCLSILIGFCWIIMEVINDICLIF